MVDKVKQGKKNRASGADFEKRVRADLERGGWIVAKWSNTVKEGLCGPVKPKFNPFTKSLMMNSGGFPDFICFMKIAFNSPYIDQISGIECIRPTYEVIFVESKVNGILDKKEKEMAMWYLENNYCSKFLIAYKIKEGNKVRVEYKTFGRLDGEISES